MKIVSPETSGESFSVIYVEHKDQIIEWNASEYEKGNNKSTDTVFRHINEYFESLSEEKQNNIWLAYVEIKELMENVFDAKRLHTLLISAITNLYKNISLEEMSYWINIKSDIKIPLSIKNDYDITDPVDRTYVRKDYIDLILMSLALRPVVPVWSEYNYKVKSLIGNHYKEFQSLALLRNTEIFQHKSMEKLRIFVGATTYTMTDGSSDGNSIAAIVGGLGTEELPEWLLALSVVRRIAVADLDHESESGSIIANIFSYIRNSIKSLDKRFKGKIKKKENTKGEDEDNASVIEGYKIKQDQSDGDIAALSVFANNEETIVRRIEPNMDPNKLKACINAATKLGEISIQPHQIALTQWVIHPIISGRGIPHLNKTSLLNVMGIAQAILWERGYIDLAKLVLVKPFKLSDEILFGNSETKSLIPKEIMDELVRIYPYFPKLQNKQQGERKSNPAAKAIDLLTKEIIREQWHMLGPVELIGEDIRMIAPVDIKSQLANFLIDRSKRTTNV